MAIECVIFDCDGVLVDSEDLSNGVLIEMASEVGAEIDMHYVEQHLIGKSLSFMFNKFEELSGNKVPDDFEQRFRQRTFAAFEAALEPIPGIRELLEQLKVPFCVASNGPVNKVELNLKVTGLFPFFEGNIFSAYQLQKWKPEPDLFLHAAKTMGYSPSNCLIVEDSKVGVQAAVAGGFEVIGFAKDWNEQALQEAGAKHLAYGLEQVEQLFQYKGLLH